MPIKSPPPQHQESQPGEEHEMTPPPEYEPRHPGAGKLKDRVVLISGGDSGIGRAVSLAMAREGARIAFIYLEEDQDAADTLDLLLPLVIAIAIWYLINVLAGGFGRLHIRGHYLPRALNFEIPKSIIFTKSG